MTRFFARAMLPPAIAWSAFGCAPAPDEEPGDDVEEAQASEDALLSLDRSCELLVARDGEPLVAGFSHGTLLRSWVFVAAVDDSRVLVFGVGYAPLLRPETAWMQMADCLEALYGSSEPKDALVVFDHWHFDHTQAYRLFNDALGEVTYYGHALDADKERAGSFACPDLLGVPAGYARYAYPTGTSFVSLGAGYPGDVALQAGDWTLHWCPGHTAGTLCASNAAEDIVLASDWVDGHGLLLPCGNDDPAAGFTGQATGCGQNPELAETTCIGQSRAFVHGFATRCNAHGDAGGPCCGLVDDGALGCP